MYVAARSRRLRYRTDARARRWRRSVPIVVRVLADGPRRGAALRIRAVEVAAGAVLAAMFVAVSAHIPPASDQRHLDALGYALLVSAGASVALWRRWPQVVVGVATAVLGFVIGRHYPNGTVWITGWVALLALSWRTNRRTALIGAGVMFAVLSIVAVSVDGPHTSTLLPVIFLGWSAAAVLLGDVLRNRRNYLTGLDERARYLEATREEEAWRRVAEDRLRIARDLHDSVAHAMATINVQAGAQRLAGDQQPPVGQPVDRPAQRLTPGRHHLAVPGEVGRDDLADSPVCEPQPAVVPAGGLHEGQPVPHDARSADARVGIHLDPPPSEN